MPIDTSILAAMTGPIITALIGALAVVFRNLRTTKRIQDQRARVLSQATQEASFIDSWVSVHAKVDMHPEQRRQAHDQALQDLQRLYGLLRSVDIEEEPGSGMTAARFFRSFLLLGLRRTSAKVVRAFYYLVLALTLFLMLSTLAFMLEEAVSGAPDATSTMIGGVVVFLGLSLPSVGLWFIARALNDPPSQQQSFAQQYPPPPYPAQFGAPPGSYPPR